MTHTVARRACGLALMVLLGTFQDTAFAQAPARVAWSVRDAAAPELRPGAEVAVTVVAAIEPDWHIYSLTQKEGGPIALSISVPSGEPFVLAGAVSGPKPEVQSDATLGIPVEWHSGTTEFRVPLKVAAGGARGVVEGRIVVRYQACSTNICLPPRSVTLPVRLEQRGAL